MKRHVARMSWIHSSSSLKLCGGHETPDNLMGFDFKMPPALFLCWARTFSQFSSSDCVKSQEDSIDPLTHTHTYTVQYTHNLTWNDSSRDPVEGINSSRSLFFVSQPWERVSCWITLWFTFHSCCDNTFHRHLRCGFEVCLFSAPI